MERTWLAGVDASRRARPPGHGRWAWRGWLAAVRRFDPPRISALGVGAVDDADDSGAVLGAAGGRDAAALDFEGFLARHEREVWGYLWRMTGDEQAAYDLAQEAFVRAWQRYERVRRYDRPKAWLFRVATNLALNHLRHAATPLGGSVSLDATSSAASEMVTTSGDADDLAQGLAERDAVRRALLELAPRQRAGLVLREVHGLSCGEVARALGISGAAAKMLLFRARERFRASYERQEEL